MKKWTLIVNSQGQRRFLSIYPLASANPFHSTFIQKTVQFQTIINLTGYKAP